MPRGKVRKIFSKTISVLSRGHLGEGRERKDVLTARYRDAKAKGNTKKANQIKKYYNANLRRPKH